MIQRKKLETTEQIEAAYPVHAKVKAFGVHIEAAQIMLEYLQNQGVVFCQKVDPEEWEGQEYAPAYNVIGSFHRGGIRIEKIFEAFELDYDKFMNEKDDMIDQVRLRYDNE